MATTKSFWERRWRELPDVVRDGPLSNPQNRLPSNQAYDLLKDLFPALPSRLRARRYGNNVLTSEDERTLNNATEGYGQVLDRTSQLATTLLALLEEFRDRPSVIVSTKSRSKSGSRAEAVRLTKLLVQEQGPSLLQPPLDHQKLRTWVIHHYSLANQTEGPAPLTKHAVLGRCEDPVVERDLTDRITRLWAARPEPTHAEGFKRLPDLEANPFPRDLDAETSRLEQAMVQAAEFLAVQDPHEVERFLGLRGSRATVEPPRLLPEQQRTPAKPRPLDLSIVEQLGQALSYVVPRAETIDQLLVDGVEMACSDFGLTTAEDHRLLVVAASLVQYPIDSDVSVTAEPRAQSTASHHLSELFSYVMRRFFGGASVSDLPLAVQQMLATPILFAVRAVWRRLYHHALAGTQEPPHLTLNRAFLGWLRAYAARAETAIDTECDVQGAGDHGEVVSAKRQHTLDVLDALLTDRHGRQLVQEFALATLEGDASRQWMELAARASALLSNIEAEALLADFTFDTATSVIENLARPDAGTHDADE